MRTAVQAPRMNATCERLIGTLRSGTPGPILILGEEHLQAVLAEYQDHYNRSRPHQGINQRTPESEDDAPRAIATALSGQRVHRKPVLSGLINEYTRAA
ncbi:MAG: integrase core domain-containing protein [Streptosporangiaceae bacterium]